MAGRGGWELNPVAVDSERCIHDDLPIVVTPTDQRPRRTSIRRNPPQTHRAGFEPASGHCSVSSRAFHPEPVPRDRPLSLSAQMRRKRNQPHRSVVVSSHHLISRYPIKCTGTRVSTPPTNQTRL